MKKLFMIPRKKKVTKENSLKKKLLKSYILISFIPIVLISTLTYVNVRYSLTNKVTELSKSINSQTKLNIDKYIIGIENSTSTAFSNSKIVNFNPKNNEDPYKTLNDKKEIEEDLRSLSLLNNCTDFALIYDEGTTIGQLSKITTKLFNTGTIYEQLNKILDEKKSKVSWITGVSGNFDKVFYIRRINDCILLVSVNTDELINIFSKMEDINNTTYYLVDEYENIIFSTNSDEISKSYKDISYDDSLMLDAECNNGWRLVSSIPKKYIFKELTNIAIFTLFIGILCMIFAIVSGLIISRKISSPINKLRDKIKQFADGDLTVKCDIHTKDEIEELSNNFNIMVDKIQLLIKNSRDVADTVLEQSREISEMSGKSHEISQNISLAMGEIADGSCNQLKEVENTILAMENLTKGINNISSNIGAVSRTSAETKNIGDKSIEILNELQIKTNNTNLMMDEIVNNITVLANSIGQIENVIKIIDDLNEQTNLLSLNAGIEAARAGEHGKGFAVVAEEIRNLANQSKSSTVNIYKVIKNIYSNAASARDLINSSTNVFKEQSDAVQFTNQSFLSVIEATKNITDSINLIENLMHEVETQKNKSVDFTNYIKEITETFASNTEEVLASLEEQTNSVEELNDYSNTLNMSIEGLEESLNVFKIE
ncbi:methyl-accepting chemotaxis protein [Clostridium butyricum]